MSFLYCSQRHENSPGNQFCQVCGEKLTLNSQVQTGMLLGDRYQIVRELGQGGFGRTYLAKDSYRFQELCVLKEFAPQVQGTYALQKAEELFAREADTLYQLQHPQIPKFRELFRVQLQSGAKLFLVQDYVEGQSYYSLLQDRRRQGQTFTQAEVLALLQQLLPVLQYIHSFGVIHRDISPDNLILRHSDRLPVLIDFGGVKQVAVAASQFMQNPPGPATRLGKVGYAPAAQMNLGQISPESDLYALAITALVLLTGQEPQSFSPTLLSNLSPLSLQPELAAILERMLGFPPERRYRSAQEVLQTLQALKSRVDAVQTVTALPPSTALPPVTSELSEPAEAGMPVWTQGILGVALCGLVGFSSWWIVSRWLSVPAQPPASSPTAKGSSGEDQLSPEEKQRKQELQTRRAKAGVSDTFLNSLVNQQFFQHHPDLKERSLTLGPEDTSLRAEWDQLAMQLLDQLKPLSPESRRRLGQYGTEDVKHWRQEVSQRRLSLRSFYDLVDAQFFHYFPNQRKQAKLSRPMEQVWSAIATDQLKELQTGATLERIKLKWNVSDYSVSNQLAPGKGQAFVVRLSPGQSLRLNLQAGSKVLLSLYPPNSQSPPLLEDSTTRTWFGELKESGYYEIIVVSQAESAVPYLLTLGVSRTSPKKLKPETRPQGPPRQ